MASWTMMELPNIGNLRSSREKLGNRGLFNDQTGDHALVGSVLEDNLDRFIVKYLKGVKNYF